MERYCRRPVQHIDEYATARVQGSSGIAVEMDGFQFRVGGDVFNVEARLDSFIPSPTFKDWMVRFQQRPSNILIRPNLATSVWQCLGALVAMREADIFDQTGAGVSAGNFLRILTELEDEHEPDAASFRWAVVINDDLGIGLRLQTLPAAPADLAGSLNGPLRQASYEEVSARIFYFFTFFAKSCVVSIQKLASYMCLNWEIVTSFSVLIERSDVKTF